jgi:hypothetical protein
MPSAVNIRAFSALGALLLVVLLSVLGWEFSWRYAHQLAKPPAPSPDEAYVAEVRALPDAPPGAPRGTGVYLRGRWAWLRALQPRLVFAGECDEVSTRWFGPRRLVIECELRAGEPRQLQDLVDGIVIEVVVQRRFAFYMPGASSRTWTLRNLMAPPGMLLAPSAYCSANGPCANFASCTSTVCTPFSTTVSRGPRAVIS